VRPIPLLTAALVAALATGCGSANIAGHASPAPSPTPTSNGVADLSATQILARAKDAFESASAVHVKGSVVDGGQHIGVDVRIKNGSGGRGTLTIDGKTVEVLRVGATTYLRGDEAFWRASTGNPEAGKLLKGKYLAFPTSNAAFKDLATFTDIKAMGAEFGTVTNPKKGSRKTVRGIDTIGLIDPSPDGGTLYVALQGKPYPMRTESARSGAIDYLDYNQTVPLTKPPADQVIDISKLGGG
jgi:hypothetical protein